MAQRISRKSITTTTTSSETPSRSGVSPGRRARSPSPARITRMQEKEQLQNLNDRLAAYIDRVRYLENENSRLSIQVRSTEETVSREVSNIKALYDSELDEARRALDDASRERAKAIIDADRYKTEAGDWQAKYHKRDRDAKAAEKKVLDLQSQVGDLQARFNDADNAKKQAEKEQARLRGELADLERQLKELQKKLEEETTLRVDYQNRCQSLKEELEFKDKIHAQEMNETRTRTSTIYDEMDAGREAEYETRLQDALQQMRAEQDDQLRQVREDVEELYERKVTDLQGALNRSMTVGSTSRDEYLTIKRKSDELQSEVTKLRTQNAELESRVNDLENLLKHESDMYEAHLAQKEAEIEELRFDLNEQTKEYADLLEIKMKLDNEIEAYRKLLEGEEERLNLSQSSSSSQSTPKKGSRGLKRKRVTLDISQQQASGEYEYASESQAKGAIEIHDTDHEGRFIKMFNTGDDDIVLGGWVLKHTAGDQETTYKFHRNLHIKAGQFCTVWSSNAGQTHNPPTDLVMKGQQWFTGEAMKTVLLHDDEEQASRELTKKESRSSVRYSRIHEGNRDGDQCSIM